MPSKRTASTKRQVAAEERSSDSEGSPPAETVNETKEKASAAAKKKMSGKRKVSEDDEAEGSSQAAKNKKAKTATDVADSKDGAELAPNGQPTNKTLPVHIQFPPKNSDSIRIASWNICGLAASSKKVCNVVLKSFSPLMKAMV